MSSQAHRARGSSSGTADPPSSMQMQNQPLAADPGSAAASPRESDTLREGWRLYGAGRLDEARRLMMLEAAHAPEDPEAAYLLGMIFKARGEADNADKAFAAATRTADRIPDRIRSDMLRRLATANLKLLHSNAIHEGGRSP